MAKFERIYLAGLRMLCYLAIGNAIVYYIFKITPGTSLVILILSIIYTIRNWKLEIGNYVASGNYTNIPALSQRYHRAISIILFFLLEAFLFILLLQNRTDGLLQSPWQAVGPWFFILYAFATAVLFAAVIRLRKIGPALAMSSAHMLLTFGVAAIVYKLGFGFDAFIHRATEVWIQTHGFILPKQPYYIGQYSLVAALSHIIRLQIFYIDVWLVPILASLLLPASVAYSLNSRWKISLSNGLLLAWLIPFIPFFPFHLTTPFNLALLLGIIAILLSLSPTLPRTILFLISFAALATHPLIGAPLFIFTVVTIICGSARLKGIRHSTQILNIITAASTALALPLLFTLNNFRSGAGLPAITNPILHIKGFFQLFARPYWYAKTSAWQFELLYAWQWLIVPIVLFFAAFGYWQLRKQKENLNLYISAAIGCFISAWLLRSWIVFHDVVAYEQGDYPLRLIKFSLVFLLPMAMYGIRNIAYRLSSIIYHLSQRHLNSISTLSPRYLLSFIAAIILMLSFYLSYPQRNVKARFPGYNVTASDFRAVEWIHNKNAKCLPAVATALQAGKMQPPPVGGVPPKAGNAECDIDYIVLSNQLVSAAALTKYGFAKYYLAEREPAQGGGETPQQELFYYSLPTGGALYQQYGRMLYEGQKREYMEHAMDLAGVKAGYFVVNSYWANSEKIIDGAKKTAYSWHVIDDGKVWIFEYRIRQ